VLFGFAVLGAGLLVRATYLQVFDHEFYKGQGDARQVRVVSIPAHRGTLVDRSGEPLAVSTPIQTLWGNPKTLVTQPAAMREVAALLEIDAADLQQRTQTAADRGREFMYIKRHVTPSIAESVMRRVVRDLNGREITGTDIVEDAIPGRDLRLSLDKKLQYLTDSALRDAVTEHQAESASVVVMDVHTGEIRAMANLPGYNPNDTADRSGGRQRNRALTDVFEPGSTMKTFTIAAALDSGEFEPDDIVYTSPGSYQIGKYEISDTRDHGWLDLRGIVTKSSNVGVSKVATSLDPEQMWSVFDRFGFGRPPGSEFPGEVPGYFNHPTLWHYVEQASVSYGYGISVSALQLVRAYAAIAADGVMPPVSFLAVDNPEEGTRVIDEAIAKDLQSMLEGVVVDGTGARAAIPGYRIAGKTGTSHRSQSGGYAEDQYVSVFAGFAPVSDPQLAVVVVVHDPKAGEHFGSVVAAPVFKAVMSHALRLDGVEPDDIDDLTSLSVPVVAGDRS